MSTPLVANRLLVWRAASAVVAATWAHQGLWSKVFGRQPQHETVVAHVPGIGEARGRPFTVAIGLLETALAIWVLNGRAARAAAMTQTAVLIGMNGGAMLFSRDQLINWPRMLLRNAGFLVLVWALPLLGDVHE